MRSPICSNALFIFALFVLYYKRNLAFLVSSTEIRLFVTSKVHNFKNEEEEDDDEAFFVKFVQSPLSRPFFLQPKGYFNLLKLRTLFDDSK